MQLHIGDNAPDFKAIAVGGIYGGGQQVKLADFKGSTLVLYFYPKDETPGCTRQACDLRVAWGEIQSKAELFGVSVDDVESHQKFIKRYGLPFPLLSDQDHAMVEAFGVWSKKSMFGKTFMGSDRTTFVIGPDLKIVKMFEKVKPTEHAATLLKVLDEKS